MRSGRICPESGFPALECAGTCGSPSCPAKKIPDGIVLQLLKNREEKKQYITMKHPSQFKTAATYDWMDQVRQRLIMVMPETSLDAAERYLCDASFLLYVWRGLQGVLKSESKDLIGPFEKILKRKADAKMISDLKAMLGELRGMVGRESVDEMAMRSKALYYLIRAAEIKGTMTT